MPRISVWSYLNQMHNIMHISLHGSNNAPLHAKQRKCMQLGQRTTLLFNLRRLSLVLPFPPISYVNTLHAKSPFASNYAPQQFIRILAFNLIAFKLKSKLQQ